MEMMLVIEPAKCTGCRQCEMACAVRHTGTNDPTRSRIHIVKWPREGFELPMVCLQCEVAPCVAACRKDALFQEPSKGLVALDYELCIGCKLCVTACPFGGMGFDTVSRKVFKCDLCEGDPICVRYCEPGALRFVPSNSVSLVKKRSAGLELSEVLRKSLFPR